MSKHLRDRIAAVLSQHDVNLPDKVADAVIATLQLGKETGCGCLPVGSECNCSYRHCTTWSPCGTVDD